VLEEEHSTNKADIRLFKSQIRELLEHKNGAMQMKLDYEQLIQKKSCELANLTAEFNERIPSLEF
jgi:hypothetical protein